MKLRFYITFFLVFVVFDALNAQQFTMKGGVIYSRLAIPKNENRAGHVSGLNNYYYEANYSQRFGKRKYWTIGFGYLGSGGTIYGQNAGLEIEYIVHTRFSNLIFPIKFKYQTEHIKHPRFYCFAGVAPAWMFDEDRKVDYAYFDERLNILKSEGRLRYMNVFNYHAQKLQGYVMTGCGVYYKHIVLDVSAMVNVFHVYKEFLAPVSLSYGVIATLGVQVSRPINKYSCHSFL
ncbi:MAG: hypothetical protein IJ150_14110 [Bacteroidales bacterium]|nr:hypothetical protein [Bacteroidales bacterium]